MAFSALKLAKKVISPFLSPLNLVILDFLAVREAFHRIGDFHNKSHNGLHAMA